MKLIEFAAWVAALLGLAQAGRAQGPSLWSQRREAGFIAPDDSRLAYSEYVNAQIGPTRASFDRPTVNWLGNPHSPGTRIGFTTDATAIDLRVEYFSAIAASGTGMFRLEVDGQLQPALVGSDTAQGVQTHRLEGVRPFVRFSRGPEGIMQTSCSSSGTWS